MIDLRKLKNDGVIGDYRVIGDAVCILGDCDNVLPHIRHVDAIITDPPYGVTLNDWDATLDLGKFWLNLNPTVKDDAAICIFSQQPFTTDIISSNRKNFRYDIVWQKQKKTGFLNAKKMPLRAHENILVFYRRLPTYNPQKHFESHSSWRKGKRNQYSTNYGRRLYEAGNGSTDGSRYPSSVVFVEYEPEFFKKTETPMHPTQKPVGIKKYLVNTYSNENDLVLDPFMGSGTTGCAAAQLGRRFIGIERDRSYFDIACHRIEAAHLQGASEPPKDVNQPAFQLEMQVAT